MADKKVKIGIETTANTKGANAATDALRETAAAADQLDGSTTALNNKLTVTGNTSEGVASKMRGPLRGTIQQAGYQIQDFAVQVAAGTSAVTAFGQQAPQLLGAFGPAGAIAGAVISIGALAYGVFSKMGDNVQSATEKLKEMEAAADDIVKNKGLELEGEFADSARAIDNAVNRAAALKQEFIDTKKAVNALALAQLELAAENAKAARTDMEIKGRPANMKQADWEQAMAPLKAVEAAAVAAVAKNQEVARQALVTDQDRLKSAQEAVAEAAKLLAAREAEKAKAAELLAAEREILETLRKQKEAKEKVVKAKFDEPTTEKGKSLPERVKKKQITDAAEKDLSKSSPFTTALRVAEERISKLEASLNEGGSKLNTDITAAQDKLEQLKTKLTDTTGAVVVGAAVINSELERKTIEEIGLLKEAGLDTGRTVTDAAKDAIKAIETEASNQKRGLNPLEQDAVERVRKLIADTVPDSAQGSQLQGVLQSLANNLTAKDAALAGGVERLIGVVRAQAGQYTGLLNQIKDLEARVRQTK